MDENNQEYILLKSNDFVSIKITDQTITMDLNFLGLLNDKYNMLYIYIYSFAIIVLLISMIGLVTEISFISFNNIRIFCYFETLRKIFFNFIKNLLFIIFFLIIISLSVKFII